MEKEEKKTGVSGVYLVLAALTVLFAVSLVFLHKTSYEGTAHGDYTVSVQDVKMINILNDPEETRTLDLRRDRATL